MTFKLYIYYCALCGGWGGFFAWGLLALFGVAGKAGKEMGEAAMVGAILGMLVAAAIGLMDAILNTPSAAQRMTRMLLCAGVGLFGGLIGSLLGYALYDANGTLVMMVIGWMIAGLLIGASVGVYDLIVATPGGKSRSIRKLLNGVYGGLLGGFIGGFPFGLMLTSDLGVSSSLAIGLVLLGICIGLLVALAHVVLKQSWIVVIAGRRIGKEMMLAKDEIVIGRAEGTDIGLFGEQGVERTHARLRRRGNQYYVEDAQTPAGTFLNDAPVSKPTPLKNGDAIRVGSCVLRFREREKQR